MKGDLMKNKNKFIVVVLCFLSSLIILYSVINNSYQKEDNFSDISLLLISAIIGDRTSEDSVIKMYQNNKAEMLEIVDFLGNIDNPEEKTINIIMDEDVTINMNPVHYAIYEDVTDIADEEIIEKIRKVFKDSKFYEIRYSKYGANHVRFSVESNSFKFYNGIVITIDKDEKPNCTSSVITKLENIEDNVYYFESK